MKKKLIYTSIILFALTFVSKILAYGKEAILAYYYGASSITDNYIMAQNITNCLFSAVTTAIVIGYISLIVDEKKKNESLNNVLYYVNIFFILLIGFMMIFSRELVSLFAPGFDEQALTETSYMIRIIAPFCLSYSFNYIIGADLQSKNVFWFIGLKGVISNIILILVIIFSNKSTFLLSIGYGVSLLSEAIFVFVLNHKRGFRYSAKGKDLSFTKKIVKMSYPILFVEVFANVMIIIDKMFASRLGEGVISSVNYSNRVITLIVTFFVSIISTVLFPSLVSKARSKDYDEYKRAIGQIFIYVLLIILPISLLSVIFSKEIVEILYKRGAFDSDMATMTSNLLFIYAIGVPSLALNSILKSQLYSLDESKKSMIFSFITFGLNIVLNIILIKIMGYEGLPTASIIASYTLTVIIYAYIVHKIGKFEKKYLFVNFFKLIAATFGMCLSIILIRTLIHIDSNIISLIIYGGFSLIVYILLLKILRFEELNYIFNLIFKRSKVKNEKS